MGSVLFNDTHLLLGYAEQRILFKTDEYIPAQPPGSKISASKQRNAKMSYVLTPTNALAKAGSREVYVSTGSHFLLRARLNRLLADILLPGGCAGIFSVF